MTGLIVITLIAIAIVIMNYVLLIYYPSWRLQQKNAEINELKVHLKQCQQENNKLREQLQIVESEENQ